MGDYYPESFTLNDQITDRDKSDALNLHSLHSPTNISQLFEFFEELQKCRNSLSYWCPHPEEMFQFLELNYYFMIQGYQVPLCWERLEKKRTYSLSSRLFWLLVRVGRKNWEQTLLNVLLKMEEPAEGPLWQLLGCGLRPEGVWRLWQTFHVQ